MTVGRISPHKSGSRKPKMADIKQEFHCRVLFASSNNLIYITFGFRRSTISGMAATILDFRIPLMLYNIVNICRWNLVTVMNVSLDIR